MNRVEEEVRTILKRFGLDYTEEQLDLSLTGNQVGFNGVTLTFLVLEVQKVFNIKIPLEDIKDYEFNTIRGICQVIERIQNRAGNDLN